MTKKVEVARRSSRSAHMLAEWDVARCLQQGSYITDVLRIILSVGCKLQGRVIGEHGRFETNERD